MKAFKHTMQHNAISRFRRKWSLSQQEIADQVRMSRSMVSMMEQGRRLMPTNVLIQLAQLETKLASADGPVETPYTQYTEGCSAVTRCRRHCEQLAARESVCRSKAMQLKEKLKTMTGLYQKTVEWMAVIALHIKGAGDNGILLALWKKHELTAIRTLDRCNLPTQLLLRHTIEALDAEAEMLSNKQLQIKQELAAFIIHAGENA
jgi:transcriptional regulator with XRE-family HTH domain